MTKITVKNPALPSDTMMSIPGIDRAFKNGDSYELTDDDKQRLEVEYGKDWQKSLKEAGLVTTAKKGGE